MLAARAPVTSFTCAGQIEHVLERQRSGLDDRAAELASRSARTARLRIERIHRIPIRKAARAIEVDLVVVDAHEEAVFAPAELVIDRRIEAGCR